jgi:hypothetical protein
MAGYVAISMKYHLRCCAVFWRRNFSRSTSSAKTVVARLWQVPGDERFSAATPRPFFLFPDRKGNAPTVRGDIVSRSSGSAENCIVDPEAR